MTKIDESFSADVNWDGIPDTVFVTYRSKHGHASLTARAELAGGGEQILGTSTGTSKDILHVGFGGSSVSRPQDRGQYSVYEVTALPPRYGVEVTANYRESQGCRYIGKDDTIYRNLSDIEMDEINDAVHFEAYGDLVQLKLK